MSSVTTMEAPVLTAEQAAAKMPSQIKYIIGNEACERFSFYGMRTILVVFMMHNLGMAESMAKSTYHLFVSAAYLLPLLGGFLSDRILGKYKTIMTLSLVYCAGHAVLAISPNANGLYLGLGLIALGAGGIKPCVSAHVGDQFTKTNAHLVNKVFDWFYWSINFGAFFSSLLTPLLLNRYGHGVAFGVPGVLMFLATIVFWMGRKQYVNVPPTKSQGDGFLNVLWYALTHRAERKAGQEHFMDVAKTKFSNEAVEAAKAASRIGRVFLTVSIFWALFDQHGSSWVILTQKMDPMFFGIKVDPSQLQAANPILVLLLIPFFSVVVYPLVGKLGVNLTALRKMGTGMYVAALSFVITAIFQTLLDQGVVLNSMWMLLPYIVLTVAEVMISITGLEFAYTQAPRRVKSTIMSFWFLTVFAGNLITAYISAINVFSGAGAFLFFAGLMLVVSVIFTFEAAKFKVQNYIEG